MENISVNVSIIKIFLTFVDQRVSTVEGFFQLVGMFLVSNVILILIVKFVKNILVFICICICSVNDIIVILIVYNI